MIAGVQDTWTNYFALTQVRGENERLRDEVARLRIELQREQALASQSRTLQDLLELKGSTTLDEVLSTCHAEVLVAGEV